jgi:hypothetical protein
MGAEGLNPRGTDRLVTTTATALKVLPIAAKHSTQLYISGSLSELALGAVAISYGAIAMLIRRRGSTVATVAVLLGGVDAFCGAVVNVLVGISIVLAAEAAPVRIVGNGEEVPVVGANPKVAQSSVQCAL